MVEEIRPQEVNGGIEQPALEVVMKKPEENAEEKAWRGRDAGSELWYF